MTRFRGQMVCEQITGLTPKKCIVNIKYRIRVSVNSDRLKDIKCMSIYLNHHVPIYFFCFVGFEKRTSFFRWNYSMFFSFNKTERSGNE